MWSCQVILMIIKNVCRVLPRCLILARISVLVASCGANNLHNLNLTLHREYFLKRPPSIPLPLFKEKIQVKMFSHDEIILTHWERLGGSEIHNIEIKFHIILFHKHLYILTHIILCLRSYLESYPVNKILKQNFKVFNGKVLNLKIPTLVILQLPIHFAAS